MSDQSNNATYQWIIITAASVCCVIWSGMGYYVFSVFVKPLQSEFGWNRSAIMAGFLTWSLTTGVSSIFVGRAVDRFHPKQVMLMGAIITCCGFICLGFIQSLIHLYLSYVIVGIGIAAMGQVPCSALVSEWFDKRRGLAIGFMSFGVGIGGLIFPPLTSGILIPAFGWRMSYVSLGVMAFLVVFPLTLFIIRPKSTESNPNISEPNSQERIQKSKKNPYLKSPLLWVIAAGFLFSQTGLTGTIQSQVPHLIDIGFSAITAASVLGMIGLISSFAKFFYGWLCDIIPVRFAFVISVIMQAAGTAILIQVSPESSSVIIWGYALFIAAGGGSWLPIMSMFISRSFPMERYGALFGIVNFSLSVGVAIGPLFAGLVYDRTGSYRLAFLMFLALYALAILMGFLSRPKSQRTNPL